MLNIRANPIKKNKEEPMKVVKGFLAITFLISNLYAIPVIFHNNTDQNVNCLFQQGQGINAPLLGGVNLSPNQTQTKDIAGQGTWTITCSDDQDKDGEFSGQIEAEDKITISPLDANTLKVDHASGSFNE